jgi:hypothetical protein
MEASGRGLARAVRGSRLSRAQEEALTWMSYRDKREGFKGDSEVI